jgi:hypothetical protein
MMQSLSMVTLIFCWMQKNFAAHEMNKAQSKHQKNLTPQPWIMVAPHWQKQAEFSMYMYSGWFLQ